MAGTGEGRATEDALRFRFSSEEEGYGEWLLCRSGELVEDNGDLDGGREVVPLVGLSLDLGLTDTGFDGTTTCSTRILGGSVLNLFFPPNRGILDVCASARSCSSER